MKTKLANNMSSSFNYSLNQIGKILLLGIRDMSKLNDTDKTATIKIYLSYLIFKYNVPITSVTELQVYLYQLSINLEKNQLDPGSDCTEKIENFCVGSIQHTSVELANNIKCESAITPSDHILDTSMYHFGKLSSGSSTDILNARLLLERYKNDVSGYLKNSEQALDIAINNFVDKLLAVIMETPTLADDKNSLFKLIEYFYSPRRVSSKKKYDVISKYHKKGLFVLECKKLYMKELLKDAL